MNRKIFLALTLVLLLSYSLTTVASIKSISTVKKSVKTSATKIKVATSIIKNLFINEIGVSNKDNKDGVWIELYNMNEFPIDLKGYYLSNDSSKLNKWEFPKVIIEPERLLTVKLGKNEYNSYHQIYADLNIDIGNESIFLTSPDGKTLVDELKTITIPIGQSYGRYPDGSDNLIFFKSPTKSASNDNIDLTYAPGKPGIALTWDDDSVDQWDYLLSFDWFRDTRSTFCIAKPGKFSEDKWEKLRNLKNLGNEMACHGMNHENANEYTKAHGIDAYINNEIIPCINLMTSKGIPPDSFSYPSGAYNKEIDAVILKYFKAVRRTNFSPEGNIYSWGTNSKFILANGVDFIYKYTLYDYLDWLNKAKEKNQVVVLYGHSPSPYFASNYNTPYERLERIVKRAKELGLTFYTLSDLAVEVGSLKVDFYPNEANKSEWTLDRKVWYKGGDSIKLPEGKYNIIIRNAGKDKLRTLDLKKNVKNEITIINTEKIMDMISSLPKKNNLRGKDIVQIEKVREIVETAKAKYQLKDKDIININRLGDLQLKMY